MLHAKRVVAANVATLAAALVLLALVPERNQRLEAEVFRVEDVASGCRWHTGGVAVDKANETEVALKQLDRKGDFLALSVLIDVVNGL